MVTRLHIPGSSISGMHMTDAVTRFSGGTPIAMYALSTESAMAEKPARAG